MATFEKRVAAGADDVEQRGSAMSLTSSDLELVVDGATNQKVGLRFTAIDIPAGAIITSAYIQFQTDEVGSASTSLQIRGIDVDDAAPFTTASNNLSSRPTTGAFASWAPSAWTIVDEAGAAQRTPNLTGVLQEIIDRSGWVAGNDLGFVITGTGTRTASAFEDGSAKAPLLHIEYTLPGSNAAPALDLDASAAGTGYATIFTEGGAAIPIADSDVRITDPDDSQMERLTATIINPKSGDLLLVNSNGLPAGISVDPSSTASKVILTGPASLAAYQTAVRQVLFNNTSADPDPASRRVEVTVNDGLATSSVAVANIAMDTESAATILEKRVVAGADDVEQRGSAMSLTSSDLELVVDGATNQKVGLRFTAIDIPAGAIITSANIQFQTDEVGSASTSLQIRGIDVDDAAPFTTASNNLSSRPTTGAFASWAPAAWTIVDEAGAAQRTPNLTGVLQEIIDRSGWVAGNDLSFVITGTGTRTASAFEDGAAKAPLLHIEYIVQQSNDIVLTMDPSFRENVAGAVVGTLSVANSSPGESYVFSETDSRFQVVGNQLKLSGGVRLDFERTPTVPITVTATDSGGQPITDTVTAFVADVPETRFAAFGDYGNRAGTPLVAQLVKALDVDFIITTGDNVYGDEPIDGQIGRYYSDYIGNYTGAYGPGSPTHRFFPALGNHDYSDEAGGTNASAYLSYFTLPGNERYYDFVQGPVHFFVLNSNREERDGITSSSVQAQWLQDGLANSASPYNIVYFHHSPFSSGANHGSTTVMQWPFEQWGATAVLSGHDHIYERIHRDADGDNSVLPYFVTGLGGNSRYSFESPVAGSVARYNDNWGTMLIQASDESITFEFVSVTGGGMGTVIDSYTIELASLAASAEQSRTSTPLRWEDLFDDWRGSAHRADSLDSRGFPDWLAPATSESRDWNEAAYSLPQLPDLGTYGLRTAIGHIADFRAMDFLF
jgi:hypothetical protein